MNTEKQEKAVFGAGCFWGIEAGFKVLTGVISTRVGYAGGQTSSPDYKSVCSGKTGHAEVVEVVFDPNQTTYTNLLDAFWRLHNPTQLNRQGPDYGTQYRSAIFYMSPEQQQLAMASKEANQSRFSQPIVTEITAAGDFWEAEDYHQNYVEKKRQGLFSRPW